jgi:hypothetical protein
VTEIAHAIILGSEEDPLRTLLAGGEDASAASR